MDTRGTHSHKMEGREHKPAAALAAAPGLGRVILQSAAKCVAMKK